MKRPPPLTTPRPPRTRRPAARTLLLFLLLLVAGAAVNVAVAWGCVLWSPVYLGDLPRTLVVDQSLGRLNDSPVMTTRVDSGFGYARRVDVTLGLCTAELPWDYWRESGLPCLCLESAPLNQGEKATSATGIPISSKWRWLGYRFDRRLPLKPLWPGFAINTVFYAVVCWLLFAAPFAVRRRRRIKRGLCPACAYPVGTSNLCTECGKPVTARSVEAAP